jgi:hypothetical protein
MSRGIHRSRGGAGCTDSKPPPRPAMLYTMPRASHAKTSRQRSRAGERAKRLGKPMRPPAHGSRIRLFARTAIVRLASPIGYGLPAGFGFGAATFGPAARRFRCSAVPGWPLAPPLPARWLARSSRACARRSAGFARARARLLYPCLRPAPVPDPMPARRRLNTGMTPCSLSAASQRST